MKCSECVNYDIEAKECKVNNLNRVENPDQDVYCDVTKC